MLCFSKIAYRGPVADRQLCTTRTSVRDINTGDSISQRVSATCSPVSSYIPSWNTSKTINCMKNEKLPELRWQPVISGITLFVTVKLKITWADTSRGRWEHKPCEVATVVNQMPIAWLIHQPWDQVCWWHMTHKNGGQYGYEYDSIVVPERACSEHKQAWMNQIRSTCVGENKYTFRASEWYKSETCESKEQHSMHQIPWTYTRKCCSISSIAGEIYSKHHSSLGKCATRSHTSRSSFPEKFTKYNMLIH